MAADPEVRSMAALCGMDVDDFVMEQLLASCQPADSATGACAPSQPANGPYFKVLALEP